TRPTRDLPPFPTRRSSDLGLLDPVLTRAFSVAKRVRSETDIARSAVSVSYAAVELAREIFGSLSKKRVLIIGAGKMSEGTARHRSEEHTSELQSPYDLVCR